MKNNLLILLWVTCFLLPSCISIENHKRLKEKALILKIENEFLKERNKEINHVNARYDECLNSLRQHKQRLINCDNKLGVCFDRRKRKR